MHNTNFLELARNKIIKVHSVEYNKNIKAIITTKQFNRVTTKPYEFSLRDWAEIVERGWIE